MSKGLRLINVQILALILCASCSLAYVEGLSLGLPDGSIVEISRSTKGDGALVLAGEPARFVLSTPLVSCNASDLVLYLTGHGRLELYLYGSARDKKAFVHESFVLIEGTSSEIHIPMKEGQRIASFELQSSDSDGIRLSALAVGDRFSGFIITDNAHTIDSTTSVFGIGQPTQAQLYVYNGHDASLILRLHSDGDAIVEAKDGNAQTLYRFIANARGGMDIGIPLAVFDGASSIIVSSEARLEAAYIAPGNGAPLADILSILAISTPLLGDYAMYRWDILKDTLIFDFIDYSTQDAYLKRLAFFAEKPGFRGRLALDAEIESLHGWNAHDYSTATLAAFFSLARTQGFRLNDKEIEFLDTLIEYGLLVRSADGSIKEGRGAVISISRESSPALRRVFIDHEASHALYFQDAEYRNISSSLWTGLGPEARAFWKQHLVWRRYDIQDVDLCINELQAYLVQQGISSTKSYYEALVPRLTEAYPLRAATIENDAPFAIEAAIKDAKILDRYLRERWGLAAGRMGRFRRL